MIMDHCPGIDVDCDIQRSKLNCTPTLGEEAYE